MYESRQDARQYLRGSIIRYKRTPVLVEDIREGGRRNPILVLRSLTKDTIEEVPIKDPSLNFKPVPLGYGEINNMHYYVSRVPVRKWKQGLSQENMRIHEGSVIGVDFRTRMGRQSLAKTILGQYKSFKEAVKEGGAFHRDFRIAGKGGALEYKCLKVGLIDNGIPRLDERYDYLETILEEIV